MSEKKYDWREYLINYMETTIEILKESVKEDLPIISSKFYIIMTNVSPALKLTIKVALA